MRDFSEQEVQKKSNETILAKIGILLFENLECAKYECKHANDSHTLANANGKRAMITTVMDGFHSILEESEDAQKVKDVISEYEKQYREYNKKVSIIVEASDYTLCEDSDSGEIEEIISDLEGVGIEITEENRDIIIEYILGEEEDDDEE